MICTNCGNEIPDSAKVCGHCGHRLKANASGPVQVPAINSVQTKRGAPVWAWRFGGVALAGLLIGVLALFFLDKLNTPASLPGLLPVASSAPDIVQPSFPKPTFTQVILPMITAMPSPQWVTHYRSSTAGVHITDGNLQNAILSTIDGSFRISFQYKWSNKKSKICPAARETFEFIDILDYANSTESFRMQVYQNRTYDVYTLSNSGQNFIVDLNTSSDLINSTSGNVEITAVQNMITVYMDNQYLVSFKYPISNHQHNLIFLISGPTDLCTDSGSPSLLNLLEEILQ